MTESPFPNEAGETLQTEPSPRPTRRAPRHRKPGDVGLRLAVAFFVLLLVGGLGLIAYPTVADVWNRMHQSRAVAAYVEQAEDLGAKERAEMLKAAQEYNAQLGRAAQADQSDRWYEASSQSPQFEQAYGSVLDVGGTGVMGYVTIPKLKTQLPIYHGTDEGVLQIAVGHLPGSSLPVGGAGSHAVVSGHTGLPSARLLTGLDEMRAGDTFAFHVLGETVTYQVDEINVVLPDDFSHLDIDPTGDYATLITCTPYGVNSHRLLVRGHRIPNPTVPDTTDYNWPEQVFTAIVAGLIVLVVGSAGIFAFRRSRRRSTKFSDSAARHVRQMRD